MTQTLGLTLATIDTFRNQIVHTDAETLLRSLPEGSVHCIVTSPPYYGLRDYGEDGQIGLEDTPQQYVDRMVDVFELARRSLRDDGTLWLNLGSSYANDDKWGGTTGGKHVSALHGNSGIGRQKRTTGFKAKDLIPIPWMVAMALQSAGWYLRSDIIWHKPNPMPESVTDRPTKAHEYVFLLTKSARYFYDADAIRLPVAASTVGRGKVDFGGAKGRAYSPMETDPNFRNGNEQWGRTFDYKASCANGRNRRSVWSIPTEPKPFQHFAMFPQALIEPMILAGSPAQVCAVCGAPYVRDVTRHANYEKRQDRGQPDYKPPMVDSSGWKPATVIDNGFTPSCDCHADTSRGIVVDPFMGSGTTALVAQRLQRDFIGCDVNAEYVTLARDRVRYHGDDKRMVKEQDAGVQQLGLFAAVNA